MIRFDSSSSRYPYRWQRRDRTLRFLGWACILSVAGLGALFYILSR